MTSGHPPLSATASRWPPIQWEEHEWRPRVPAGAASRAAVRRQTGTYRAAVPAPVAGARLELPPEVTALATEASAEIARFDTELGSELAPFAAVLLRSEAAASSQIENLTASPRAIALAELGDTRRRNATEIVANTRAMTAAVALADRLDLAAILELHRTLMAEHHPRIAGRWREEQVWIGRGDLGPLEADFVPPHHRLVPSAMADLIAFVGRDDLPVLAQTAVAHAQFETIHPFADGNGRAGRALAHAMLRGKGLTRHVTVPVSAGLLTDTGAYVAALTRYRDGDAGGIVGLLATASGTAITNGRRLVEDLRDLAADWRDTVRARRDSVTWRVADLLLRRPVVDAGVLERELGIRVGNVSRSVAPLVAAGVLTESTGARRNRVWRADAVLEALGAFADRSGRRAVGD